MNKFVKLICLFAAVFSLALSGCGAESVELSDEDAKKVANYSSDVISQHSEKSESRLVDTELVKRKYQEQLDLEVKKQNFRAMEQAAAENEESGSSGSGEGSGDGSEEGSEEPEYVEPDISLAEAIGVPETDIYYTDYEITNSYTGSSEEDDSFLMGMTAAQGDTLVVVHFNISNTSGIEQNINILEHRPTFRVKINGENHTVQQTMLTDDLSKFDGTVDAYSSKDVVLICEVAEGSVSSIDTLSLVVRSADGRPEYKLI